jgi:hypothetical protein
VSAFLRRGANHALAASAAEAISSVQMTTRSGAAMARCPWPAGGQSPAPQDTLKEAHDPQADAVLQGQGHRHDKCGGRSVGALGNAGARVTPEVQDVRDSPSDERS